jgi:hypothetical protein
VEAAALLLKLKVAGMTVLTQTINSNQNSFTFNNLTVPKNVPVTVEAYSLLECPATLVGTTTISDLCSVNTVTLNVNTGTDRTNVNVDVTAICPHKDPVLKVKPSGYDIYVLTSCGNINVGTLNNGLITLKGFKLNTTYTFGMIYKNTLYTQDHLVDQTSYQYNYNIADSVCNSDFK